MALASLLAALTFGLVLVVQADDDQSASGTGKRGMMDVQGGPDGMQGGMMGGHMDRIKEKLGLTDSQADKLKELFKKQMENMKPLRDQMKIDMDTLQQKVDTKASEDEIKKVLETLKTDRKSMETARQKMEDQLAGNIDPHSAGQICPRYERKRNGNDEEMER